MSWASSNHGGATTDSTDGLARGVSAGTTTISATLSDVSGSTGLTVQSAPLSITTGSLPSAILGTAYSASLAAAGGTGGFSWRITSGTLPAGLTLNTATGVISGTPTAAGASSFTVRVRDAAATTTSKSLTITTLKRADGGGESLLTGDFSSTDLSDWTVVDEGVTSAPSDWRVIGGELAQLSNLYGEPFTAANIAAYGSYLRYEGGYGWSDYRVSYTQRAGDDDALGLMFRVTDADNYYRFSWHTQLGYRRLVKVVDGVFTELAADNVAYVQGRDYQIEVRVQGDRLDLWIDGTPIFQVTDADQPSGTIAFYTWAMQGGYFDDLLVEELGGLWANSPPQISAVTGTPASILDTETSQLSVTASDPDDGPLDLSYQWTVLSGGGSVDNAISAIPRYTPADVTGTRNVTLRVTVDDGEDSAQCRPDPSSGRQRPAAAGGAAHQ